MKPFILIASSLFLSSCMHLGMMGTHGDHQSGEHQATAETMLEKEVTAGNVKATAILPAMSLGKEVVFELKLRDTPSGRPISGALVSFHSTYLHKAEETSRHDTHTMHGEMDSIHARPNSDHAVSFDQEIQEGSQPGLYSVRFTPFQSGEHILMFHVSSIGDEMLKSELVIEATRNVASSDASHTGMMLGMSSISDYAVIGAVIMGVTMLVVWAIGGRMF